MDIAIALTVAFAGLLLAVSRGIFILWPLLATLGLLAWVYWQRGIPMTQLAHSMGLGIRQSAGGADDLAAHWGRSGELAGGGHGARPGVLRLASDPSPMVSAVGIWADGPDFYAVGHFIWQCRHRRFGVDDYGPGGLISLRPGPLAQ